MLIILRGPQFYLRSQNFEAKINFEPDSFLCYLQMTASLLSICSNTRVDVTRKALLSPLRV